MIWRSAVLMGCTALAYALLRGWPEFLPPVMKACAAVLVLVAGLGVWASRRATPETRARGRRVPRWLDYAVIGGGVLAVECAFLWLLGTAPQPLESLGLEIERRFRPEAAALRSINGGDSGTRAGNWLWTQETRRPLPRRTDFKPGVKPEVFLRIQEREHVAALLKGKIYVKAFALEAYREASWAPLGGEPLEIQMEEEGFIRIAPQRPGPSIVHEVFHAANPDGQNVFTALTGASTAWISPLTRIGDGLHLLPPSTRVGGYQYFAASTPLRIEDLEDGNLLRPWPDAQGGLLEIPASVDFSDRLRALARTAAGSGSVKEQLLRLQNHLRTELDYSLATTNPLNLDPIENFLFEERRGHCEYFATAGALMARALGIPSRVAYGWAGGKWYESAGLFVFRANEAHAWTEVRLENHGWVLMDPTPEAGPGDGRAQVAAPNEKLPESLSDDGETLASADSLAARDFSQLALWLMAGFALPAGLIAIMRGQRRPGDQGDGHGDGPANAPAAPDYLRLWRQACSARGMPMPPGFTLGRQVARLEDRPDFAPELVKYHYQTRYEGHAPDSRTEKALSRKIRAWKGGR